MTDPAPIIGPVLVLDDIRDKRLHLAALFIVAGNAVCPPVTAGGTEVQASAVATFQRHKVCRARFTLPADRPSHYDWNGTRFDIAGDLGGDMRLAFVSCNGEETGDLDREGSERNEMWARLRAAHRETPFALLMHGGDQIYADEATHGHPLSDGWPHKVPADPSPQDLDGLRAHLRERFFQRYAAIYAAPECAWLMARVPSLMQWDDHDICDGWGSLHDSATRSAVGQTLFAVARDTALLFQHAAVPGDLPARFADPKAGHLGWHVAAPGLRILAPDLRAERTRHAVMGAGGWEMMEDLAHQPFAGQTLLMSSVPLLGPRLSILESVILAIPKMQKYEDDLRDQWQSRAHRAEWQRILTMLCDMGAKGTQAITALSGEIHLATRAEMALAPGATLHQLVASGISHRPPPRAWARVLGLLAIAGEDPLPHHPIRIECIPGQSGRYAAERNFLVLTRRDGAWHAEWELEVSDRSGPLPLSSPAARSATGTG